MATVTLISPEQYASEFLGKKVGTGQCVGEVQNFLSLVCGVNLGAIGNAVDYASPANQAKFASVGFKWVIDQNFLEGDTLVWEDDPGSFTGVYGHIANGYQGKILNQNNNGREFVTIDNFFPQGYLGRYTKGDNMTKDEAYKVVSWDYRMGTGTDPTGDQAEYWADRIVANASAIDELGQAMLDQVNARLKPVPPAKFKVVAVDDKGVPTLYSPS